MSLKVVVPCRNESKFIVQCLESVIRACDLTRSPYQIKVVDGRSDDGTAEIIRGFSTNNPTVELIINEKQLTPFAFNLGIKSGSPTDYVAIVGARHVLDEYYFTEAIAVLTQKPDVWCVGGSVKNTFTNDYGRLVAAAMSTSFGMGLGNFRTKTESGYVDTIGTPVYPHFVFEKIGYFDERLIRNQDDDYNYRVIQAGGKVYHNSAMLVEYTVRAEPRGLRRQMMQYGYWKVFVNRKHRAVTTLRQLVPPLFVLYLLLFPLTFLGILFVGLTYSVILGVYLMLCLLTAVRLGNSNRERFQIATIFPTLHISYGWGYLKGIWRFLILRKEPAESAAKLSR